MLCFQMHLLVIYFVMSYCSNYFVDLQKGRYLYCSGYCCQHFGQKGHQKRHFAAQTSSFGPDSAAVRHRLLPVIDLCCPNQGLAADLRYYLLLRKDCSILALPGTCWRHSALRSRRDRLLLTLARRTSQLTASGGPDLRWLRRKGIATAMAANETEMRPYLI